MNIKRSDLLSALRKCSPGVDMTKVVFDASDCFVLKDKRVYSYNDKVSVSSELDLGDKVKCAVKGKELVNILTKLPSEDIDVSFTKKSMKIVCGEIEASFNLINWNDGVFEKLNIGDEWLPLGDKFTQSLGLCNIKYSTTMSDKRKEVSGVYIYGDNMISSDGKQINIVGTDDCGDNFFIHYPFVSDLLKFEDIDSVQITKAWLHFKTKDDTVISIRNMPWSSEIAEKIKKSVEVTNGSCKFAVKVPKELFDAVDRASVMSMNVEFKNALVLKVSKDCFEVSGEKTAGAYDEKVPIENVDDFESSEVYVDIDLFKYMSGREYEFSVAEVKGNQRIVFKNDVEEHIFSTLVKE